MKGHDKMKFYRFGKEDKPVIMLLPGTCCHWKTFSRVIPMLTDQFQAVCVSYDGFDENEPDAVFPSMLAETEKIESYIKAKFGGRIFAAYGCSLGGSFVGLLIGREKVHIDHGFIGSSDLDQAGEIGARIQSAIVKPILGKTVHEGKLPDFMKNMMLKKAEDPQEAEKTIETFEKMFAGISFASEESIYNQFYSDLVTPIKDNIRVDGTTVHIFYALKMGERYFERYNRHFPDADIVARDYSHEELFMSYPEQWAQDIKRCCGLPYDKEKALPEPMSYRRDKKRFFETHHYEEAVVKGCNFRYMDCGSGDKTIVFLVGGLGTSEAVFPYIKALEGKYRVITFDYPFECRDMKSLAEGIIDLLDYLDTDKAVWMGSSFGGYMAQLLAAEFPERTDAMCLFSTAALSERTIGALKSKYKALAPVLVKTLKTVPYSLVKPFEIKSCMKHLAGESAEEAYYMREMFTDIYSTYTSQLDVHMAELLVDVIHQQPCSADKFAYLDGRVLLVLPEDDDFFDRDMQNDLTEMMPSPVISYVNGGHAATLMRVDEYTRRSAEFLEKL